MPFEGPMLKSSGKSDGGERVRGIKRSNGETQGGSKRGQRKGKGTGIGKGRQDEAWAPYR